MQLVKPGDIFDQAKVIRVDRGLGLLLEVPTTPVATPAFVSMSDVADQEVKKLDKNFKEGTPVRVRILGFRNLEGLAIGILKTSAFEGSVFTHSDVKPGMVVKAKVIKVDSFGAIVQFPGGVKALCPLRHMSEFEITKPRAKFQVGVELIFRVLGCKSKRITVTHKKTLVKSKLQMLSSYADAAEGLITHGWITKIEDHGCFVHFYNGIHGFAPRSELGLDSGSDIRAMYHVEQVIKCRVTSAVPASRRINLSFIMSPARLSQDDVRLGSVVSGVVDKVTPHAVVINVNTKGYMKGMISTEHLADHHGLAVLMNSVLKPGYEFEKLLVLDMEGSNLVLTAKYSLVESSEQLPLDASQVRSHSVVHGFVCNLIDTGCFVRFLGRLTGFAPKNKALDDRRMDLSEAFYVGQSVRSNILDVSAETGRITLSLKQSLNSSTDASFIQEYFVLEEKIANLQSSDSGVADFSWVDGFALGTLVEGQVLETKDFGVVISFSKHSDVFGFISHYQLGGTTVASGSTVKATVIDVSKIERLVDLSLKSEFVSIRKQGNSDPLARKKRRRENKELEVNQTVNALVEIVKENYVVLSLPEYNYTLGYASLDDYNTQKLPRKQFSNGQSVVATVVALPNPSIGGRFLLLLKSIAEVMESSSVKRAKKKSGYNVGSLVQAEVIEIKPIELKLKFGFGFHGRVHITEATDDNAVENPFSNFRIGQTLMARIVSKGNKLDKSVRSHQWELSIKPSVLSDFDEVNGEHQPEDFSYSYGQEVSGYVYKVDNEWAWLSISRDVKAQLYIFDTACEPKELKEFAKRFYLGKAVSAYVISVNKDKRLLRLVMRQWVASPNTLSPQDSSNSISNKTVTCHFHEGDIVGGRISKILPGVGGLLVQIDLHLYGRVHYTELTDLWVSDPLSGYHEGQYVKCKILEVNSSIKGTVHVDLSLRTASDDAQHKSLAEICNTAKSPSKRVEHIEDLHPDMNVQGYVKNVSAKGCFIMLSRKVDAKILLSNLSDGYVENPEKDFPVGKLVMGKVVSVEPLSGRVEVTLKTSNTISSLKSDANDFDKFSVGDIISGIIRRVEPYGLFVTVNGTNVVGLCHISELSDDRVEQIETMYKARERVTAKVLKVDKDRRRISLGMKSSYLENDADQIPSGARSDDSIEENRLLAGTESTMITQSSGRRNMINESENDKYLIPVEVESRASVPPLEVCLDEMEDEDKLETEIIEHAGGSDNTDERNKKREKKKAKEEKEQEIRAAEERLLEKDIPRNADEFEKLVRSSPNSSFVWIKYMAFMLSLAEVEKARATAERALNTINIREESEKLNVWIAYFNLENEYGNPPKEAVTKVFQRALQYCDPKKVHLALLGMYERTEQHDMAEELLVKMVKKFKQSCKVWLRRVQFLLRQGQDGVQSLINRALLSLPRHKHIKFTTQTAILEFKCGVPDRARSMFEGMLRGYPKRTDLWSVYLDQEMRLGDADVIRALFERAISLSLPPKKMKFMFKKYLEYEKSLGDEEQIESVKKKAMDYVESTLA